MDLSVSSSSWGLGRAAACDCGTPWAFLLPFFSILFLGPKEIVPMSQEKYIVASLRCDGLDIKYIVLSLRYDGLDIKYIVVRSLRYDG